MIVHVLNVYFSGRLEKRLRDAQLVFTPTTSCCHVVHQFHSHLSPNGFVTRRILSFSLLVFVRQPAVTQLPMETTEIKAV